MRKKISEKTLLIGSESCQGSPELSDLQCNASTPPCVFIATATLQCRQQQSSLSLNPIGGAE